MAKGLIWMDIRDLKIFVAVTEEQNITKAAEQLDYAQSNVTSRIQVLETELGTTLFYRHKRGVTITPSGELLLKYARKILHLCHEVKSTLQDHSKPKGSLHIGSMETTAAVRLPEIFHQYRQNCPDVDLYLRTGPTEELIRSVLSYKFDGAFVAGPVNHPDILQEPIIDEELVLVSNDQKSMGEYVNHSRKMTVLAFREGCNYRSRFEEWLRMKGIIPEKMIEFDTLEAILGCVTAGVGITLLPRSVIERADLRSFIHFNPISEKYSQTTTYFIRRTDTIMTPALTQFLMITKTVYSMK